MRASSGPGFSLADLVVLLAFAVDVFVGPASAVLVLVALVLRNGWRGWAPLVGVTAALNLALAVTLLAFADGGLGPLVALVAVQAVLALGLLIGVSQKRWRAFLFGARAPKASLSR